MLTDSGMFRMRVFLWENIGIQRDFTNAPIDIPLLMPDIAALWLAFQWEAA